MSKPDYFVARCSGFPTTRSSWVWTSPFDDMGAAVDYIRNLTMPDELQEQWGYKPITEETKAKILGLNLARLAKIEPRKRAQK